MNSFLVEIAISAMITIGTQGEESSQVSGNDGRTPVETLFAKSESEFSGGKVIGDSNKQELSDKKSTMNEPNIIIKSSYNPDNQCPR